MTLSKGNKQLIRKEKKQKVPETTNPTGDGGGKGDRAEAAGHFDNMGVGTW